MADPTPTPNLKLNRIAANRLTWADDMNNNLSLIDATIGSFFVVQNLQGPWQNSTAYMQGQAVVDLDSSVIYQCQIAHTSSNLPTTFAQDRASFPTYWSVYSSPARSRGVWLPNTSYALNDFVVNGSQYAICIQTHVSSSSFPNDVAASLWSILIDVSSVGSSVLPVPGGVADKNKFAVTNGNGTGYTIISSANAFALLDASFVGTTLFFATDQTAARTAINAQIVGDYVTGGPYQPVGSYQPLAASLTTLAGTTPGTEGLVVLAISTLAALKAHLGGIGTVAPFDVGVAATNIPQLDGSAKMPAVDGSALTGMLRQCVTTTNNSTASGTGVIPYDNSIPQSGEGDELMTRTITPRSASSTLKVDVTIFGTYSATGQVSMALFKDAETSARSAIAEYYVTGKAQGITLTYTMVAGSTSSMTFRVRVGGDGASGFLFNGDGGGTRLFGGVAGSQITVTEIGP